jgi:hypothetical protein
VTGNLNAEIINISLTDVAGKLVFSKNISVNNQGDRKYIEFDQVGTGIYYLTVNDGEINKTIKVILTSKE